MADGTYEERLDCGGTLRVMKSGWEVRYYFPGLDLRHKGEFVTVPGASIRNYILAWNTNWAEFEQLKQAIPAGGEFSKVGVQGMSIRIGQFRPGVCIHSYHMPISTRGDLDRIIRAYEYAALRAPKVQHLLETL